MEGYRLAYFEMKCNECGNTHMIQDLWIYFATSLEKTFRCPYCGKSSTSSWIELNNYEAQKRINDYYNNMINTKNE